jgi:uncharacterized membrane protein YgdD (TMEM256/DUF423 family)
MHRGYLKTAAVLGALSVALGAFAAHTLKQSVSDYVLGIFETAVRYQFYHVFALFIAAILFREFPNRWIKWSGTLFIIGIILFSGSLYGLTTIKALAVPGLNWIGVITPFGGLCFILGWIFLFIGCDKRIEIAK